MFRLEREIFSLSEERNPISVQCNNNELNTSVLTPAMQDIAREILGESLVSMPAAAEVQLMCILKQYERQIRDGKLVNISSTNNVEQDSANINNAGQPRNMNEEKLLALSQVEHFRRCAFLASEKNKKLLDMVAASERVIRELRIERDKLKLLLSSKNDGNSSDKRGQEYRVEQAVKCKMLEADLEREKQYRKLISDDDTLSEMAMRITYLETWKENATRTIENQSNSLQATVSKSSYVEALNEIDNLKRDNTFLVDRIAVAHLSLLRYREILKSLGCSVEEDEECTTVSEKKEITIDGRLKALSVSCFDTSPFNIAS